MSDWKRNELNLVTQSFHLFLQLFEAFFITSPAKAGCQACERLGFTAIANLTKSFIPQRFWQQLTHQAVENGLTRYLVRELVSPDMGEVS
jgi:hypothetical protein